MGYIAIVPHRVPWSFADKAYFDRDSYLSVEALERQLSDWRAGSIENIDFIGGEVSRLDPDYLSTLISAVRKFYTGEITIFTDLTNYLPTFDLPGLRIAVLWNSKNHALLTKLSTLPRSFELVLLDQADPEAIAPLVNAVANIESIQFLPGTQAIGFRATVQQPNDHRQILYIMPDGRLSYGV